jgi:hypothetical protein
VVRALGGHSERTPDGHVRRRRHGFGKRFAIGLAYDTVSMNVKASKPGKLNGRLDWGYNGWLLYFKTDFGGGVSKR